MDNSGFKLFVGNISWGVDEDALRAHFEQIGEVTDVHIVKDKFNNNRSKGFGFVTFASDEDGQKAIDELDGVELDGRELNVSKARPPQPRD